MPSIKKILYRIFFTVVAVAAIPIFPIAAIFSRSNSAAYIMKGALNLNAENLKIENAFAVYKNYLARIIHLDFGISVFSGQPAIKEVLSGFPQSLMIIAIAIIISLAAGFLLNYLKEKSKPLSRGFFAAALQIVSYIPVIALAYLIVYSADFIGINFFLWPKYFLAGLALSIYPAYAIFRSIEKTLDKIKKSDFFYFYRSAGFGEKEIQFKFCAKMLILEIIPVLQNALIYMFGFIFFVESPFGINGIGRKFIIAVHRFDYSVIICFCIAGMLIFSLAGILGDAAAMLLNPRPKK